MNTLLRSALCGALALLLLAPAANATTYVVNSLSDAPSQAGPTPDGTLTLREAIIAANTDAAYGDATAGSGDDTIRFSVSGTISLQQGELSITEALYIDGPGIEIDAGSASRHVTVASSGSVVFEGLALVNGGNVARGGAVYNNGSPLVIRGGLIRFNVASGPAATDGGGGIYNDGGTLVLEGRLGIRDNRASGASGSGGGVFNANGGTVLATGVRIAGNRANRAGGGVEDASNVGDGEFALDFTNVDLVNNIAGPRGQAAPGNGGGVHISGTGDARFSGGLVQRNGAASEGGGLWNSLGLMVIDGVTIEGNGAAGAAADNGGGGVFNNGGTVRISGGRISGNIAAGEAGSGGGIHNRGVLEVSGTLIANNTANRAGGGIEDVGAALSGSVTTTATLTDVTLTGNDGGTAPGNGGGLHSGGGAVVVSGGLVDGNTAVEGGGLWASGSMEVTGTAIANNAGTGDGATKGGGGVFNQGGTVTLTGVTVSDNTAPGASGSGGGVFHNGGTTTIGSSTFSDNSASRAGGGLEAATGGSIVLTDVDFTGNSTGSAPGNGGALHVTAGTVTASGGTVSGNTAASEGGGFWNNAGWTMTVTGTTFSGNDAQGDAADNGGGGLFNNGGTLVVMDATVTGNDASGAAGSGGGLFNFGGRMEVSGTTIGSNTANRAGGGIEDTAASSYGGGTFLTDVTLTGNDAGAAPGNGGGVHSGGGYVSLASGTVSGNTAVEGGGLWTSGTMEVGLGGGSVSVTGNTASGDDATNGGGGLFNQAGTLRVRGADVSGNDATGAAGSGGGLFNNGGVLELSASTVTGNTANRAGGGLEDASTSDDATTATVTDVTFSGNDAGSAPGNGGGIHVGGPGTVSVALSTFSGNSAVEGAGLWNSGAGDLTVTTTTVEANSATRGGGIYQSGTGGTMTVDQSLLVGNSATAFGGGGVIEGGMVSLTNSTLSGNSAPDGGGLYQEDGAVALASATVARNQATDEGGGARIVGGTFTVGNSIFAENTAARGPSCFGAVVSEDYNLADDRRGCTLAGGSLNNSIRADAMLEDLADNGGPTQTHALMEGSPAIDAGQSAEDVDQRGFVRTAGQDDIGSFERGASSPGPVPPTAAAGDAPADALAKGDATAEMDGPVRLDPVAPNPLATGRAGTVTFTVRTAEPVEVSLYDVAGRRVATLYSGTPEAGRAETVALDARSLAAGVYVVRLLGETVQATRRVTLVR